MSDILATVYLPEFTRSLLLQTEIAKRLNTILAQIMPFLSQEVRLFVVSLSFQSSHWLMRSHQSSSPCPFIGLKLKLTTWGLQSLLQPVQGWEPHQRNNVLFFLVGQILCHYLRPERGVLACHWGSTGQQVPLCPHAVSSSTSASLCLKFHT